MNTKNLKYDLPASVVVFLVAIPLCLGIALASGAPLISGLISGMVGGIIVGLISKSPLGVSGPAAGLVAIVLSAIASMGSYERFLMAVVLSGIIQIAFGFLRGGIVAYYVPSSVIKGMLSAIGVIIILKQIPHAFGYDANYEGDLSFQQADGHNTFTELGHMMDSISPGAVAVALISLIILVLFESKWIKEKPSLKLVPGPLVAVIMSVILGLVFRGTGLEISSDHLVSIPIPDSLDSLIGSLNKPEWVPLTDSLLWTSALTIAVVGSIESLLCLEATDKMDPMRRVTPANRELIAQGTGNVISGLLGGLPITQVIVRSSANIQSGGRTKVSAIAHGILILIAILLIPRLMNLIPLASLAAILIVVGYKLVRISVIRSMYNRGWTSFIPYAVTLLAIVFTDLLVGIAIGSVVAVFFILYDNFMTPFHLERDNDDEGEFVRMIFGEDVTFLNKAAILRSLDNLPENTRVLVDGSQTIHVDFDVLEILDDFQKNAEFKHIELKVIHLDEHKARRDERRKRKNVDHLDLNSI
jgi:MFS superfamily sulfate permease-like transporter